MEMRTEQHGASDRSDVPDRSGVLGRGQRERSMLIESTRRSNARCDHTDEQRSGLSQLLLVRGQAVQGEGRPEKPREVTTATGRVSRASAGWYKALASCACFPSSTLPQAAPGFITCLLLSGFSASSFFLLHPLLPFNPTTPITTMQLGLSFTALLASILAISSVDAAPLRRGKSISLPLARAHTLRANVPVDVVRTPDLLIFFPKR
jgi:hypothetical protein